MPLRLLKGEGRAKAMECKELKRAARGGEGHTRQRIPVTPLFGVGGGLGGRPLYERKRVTFDGVQCCGQHKCHLYTAH